MSVLITLLQPGDTMLGMNLAHGGHLTHGHPLNFSGKFYKIVPYGVRKEDERIDYEEFERLADEHKPKLIVVGASAYPRIIDFARVGAVARALGIPLMVDMAHIAGPGRRQASTRARFRTPTSSPPRRTRRCAARAAGMVLCRAAVCEGSRIDPSSPACRAGR